MDAAPCMSRELSSLLSPPASLSASASPWPSPESAACAEPISLAPPPVAGSVLEVGQWGCGKYMPGMTSVAGADHRCTRDTRVNSSTSNLTARRRKATQHCSPLQPRWGGMADRVSLSPSPTTVSTLVSVSSPPPASPPRSAPRSPPVPPPAARAMSSRHTCGSPSEWAQSRRRRRVVGTPSHATLPLAPHTNTSSSVVSGGKCASTRIRSWAAGDNASRDKSHTALSRCRIRARRTASGRGWSRSLSRH